MKTLIAVVFTIAGACFALAETSQAWLYNQDDRSGAYAPVAPSVAQRASGEAWACPAWVEAYAEGGVTALGLFIYIR